MHSNSSQPLPNKHSTTNTNVYEQVRLIWMVTVMNEHTHTSSSYFSLSVSSSAVPNTSYPKLLFLPGRRRCEKQEAQTSLRVPPGCCGNLLNRAMVGAGLIAKFVELLHRFPLQYLVPSVGSLKLSREEEVRREETRRQRWIDRKRGKIGQQEPSLSSPTHHMYTGWIQNTPEFPMVSLSARLQLLAACNKIIFKTLYVIYLSPLSKKHKQLTVAHTVSWQREGRAARF